MTAAPLPLTPGCRLHREPFWKLVPLPGREITGPVIDSIASVSQLRNVALGAEVDKALLRSCFHSVLLCELMFSSRCSGRAPTGL